MGKSVLTQTYIHTYKHTERHIVRVQILMGYKISHFSWIVLHPQKFTLVTLALVTLKINLSAHL